MEKIDFINDIIGYYNENNDGLGFTLIEASESLRRKELEEILTNDLERFLIMNNVVYSPFNTSVHIHYGQY